MRRRTASSGSPTKGSDMRVLSHLIIIVMLSSCAARDIEVGTQAYNEGNYNLAASFLNGPAKKGHAKAQYVTGLLWKQGLGNTPKNEDEASQWFLLAAKQGHLSAMIQLAHIQKAKGYNDAALSW